MPPNLLKHEKIFNGCQSIIFEREYNKFLSFKNIPLRQGVHKIHPYPAMLHPLLVDYLLDKYARSNSKVLDPFCGSGVTLLQSGLKGLQSYGFDINPIAILISIAKTSNYNIKVVKKEIIKIKDLILNCNKIDIPTIKNIDYWYSKRNQESLGKIRYILKHNSFTYKILFIVCFSFICRDQSYTRNNEFKRYRIKYIQEQKEEVIKRFFIHLDNFLNLLIKSEKNIVQPLHLLDTAENVDNYNINYDLIITSPPYGDSRTTVAYGQFSSFALDWINDLIKDFSINYNIDKYSVGRKRSIEKDLLESSILSDVISIIREKDLVRSIDVLNFFNEYYIILKKLLLKLSVNGKVCYIVGNRRVKGIEIPTDQITAQMMLKNGIIIEKILTRDIINKVMPSINSPTNEVGKRDKTMSYEYIVIGKKINL